MNNNLQDCDEGPYRFQSGKRYLQEHNDCYAPRNYSVAEEGCAKERQHLLSPDATGLLNMWWNYTRNYTYKCMLITLLHSSVPRLLVGGGGGPK